MALVATNLTSGGNIPSGSTTFTTASISPAADALILLWVTGENLFGAPPDPTSVTGCSLTWVQVNTTGNYGNNCGETLWRALGSSPTTGTLTITYSIGMWSALWSVEQITGVSTGGTNGSAAVLQTAQNADGSAGSSLTVTLAAEAAGSMGLCGWSFNVNDGPSMSGGAGWTTLGNVQIARPIQIVTAYNTTGDNTATGTTGNVGARGGIAVEIGGPAPDLTNANAGGRSIFRVRPPRWG